MTIRYEANPPKILPGVDPDEAVPKFVEKIRLVSDVCDAIHLTENVLGFQRMPPTQIGRVIKKEIPRIPITASLRVRDKTEREIRKFAGDCVRGGFSGILLVMGDPPQDGRPDSGQIPSTVLRRLRADGLDSEIDLYLSIPNRPDFDKIKKKRDAGPKGFMTQVVQSVDQVRNIVEGLDGFSVIPIVLYPSEKNERSARFLGLDLASYGKDFAGFVSRIEEIAGDVLVTSPGDFDGVLRFLRDQRGRQ